VEEEQRRQEEEKKRKQENEKFINNRNRNNEYDVVVKIGSLRDLEKKDGWLVTYPRRDKELQSSLSKSIAAPQLEEDIEKVNLLDEQNSEKINVKINTIGEVTDSNLYTKEESLYVGVLGLYNKGKTYVMNRIAGTYVGEGSTIQTEGISFVKPCNERGQKLMLVDISGFNSPVEVVSENSISEKYCTDRFIEDMVIRLSYAIIIVVNDITLDDQIYLENLRKTIYSLRKQSFDKWDDLIVVHNFYREENLEDAQKNFKKQVETNYKDGIWKKVGVPFPYFYSPQKKDSIGMRHLFLGRELPSEVTTFTPLQKEIVAHNTSTIDTILKWIQSMAKDSLVNIIKEIVQGGNELLKRYIENPGILEFNENNNRIHLPNIEGTIFKIKVPQANKYLLPDTPSQIDAQPSPPPFDVIERKDEILVYLETSGFTEGPFVKFDPNTKILNITGIKEQPSVYADTNTRTTPHVKRFFGHIDLKIELQKIVTQVGALTMNQHKIAITDYVLVVPLDKHIDQEWKPTK